MSAQLRQLLDVRSQAVEACLVYLRGMECRLMENRLLAHVGRTLDGPLRIPLECRLHDTRKVEQELEQLEALRRSGTAVSESQLYSRRDDEHLTEEQRREREKLEEKLKPRPLDKVARELREIVALGDPGAGKSEWSRHEAFTVAKAQREKLENSVLLDHDLLLPVWLAQPELAVVLGEKDDALREFYEEVLGKAVSAVTEFAPWEKVNKPQRILLRVLWALHRNPMLPPAPLPPDDSHAPDPTEDPRLRFHLRALAKMWRDWSSAPQPRPDAPAPVLCLDARDEVRGSDDRGKVKAAIAALRTMLGPHGYRFRFTSRTVGYDPFLLSPGEHGKPVEDITFEVMPFTRQGTRKFLDAFFANDRDIASKLVAELEAKPAVSGLAENPLMLTLLAVVFAPQGGRKERIELPARRVEVFKAILEELLGPREADRKVQDAPDAGLIEEKIAALRSIAWKFWPRQLLDGTELRDLCKDPSLCGPKLQRVLKARDRTLDELLTLDDPVLVPIGNDYRFLHLTLQEYLVAEHLASVVNDRKGGGWENATVEYAENDGLLQAVRVAHLLDKKAWLPAWRQVVLLVAGLLNDPFPLLRRFAGDLPALPAVGDDWLGDRLQTAAFACGEVHEDWWKAAAGRTEWLQRFGEYLWYRWFEPASADSRQVFPWLPRAIGVFAMLEDVVGDRCLKERLNQMLKNERWETSMALLRVEHSLWARIYLEPDDFRDLLGDTKAHANRLLTVRALRHAPQSFWMHLYPEDLGRRLLDTDPLVRRAAFRALGAAPESFWGKIGCDDFLRGMDDTDFHVREAAQETLGRAPERFWASLNPHTLCHRLQSDEFHNNANPDFSIQKSKAIVSILKYAPESFWERLSPDVLLGQLGSNDYRVQKSTVQILRHASEWFWNRIVPRDFLSRLEDDRPEVREFTIRALLFAPQTFWNRIPADAIHRRIADDDPDVQVVALGALRNAPASFWALIEPARVDRWLEHRHFFWRRSAVVALAGAPDQFWAGISVENFLPRLEDEHESVRELAVRTLADAPEQVWARITLDDLWRRVENSRELSSRELRKQTLQTLRYAPQSFWKRVAPMHFFRWFGNLGVDEQSLLVEPGCAWESFWERIDPAEYRTVLEHGNKLVALEALRRAPESFWMRLFPEDLDRRLSDTDPSVRRAAFRTLGAAPERFWAGISRDDFLRGLNDTDSGTQVAALETLGRAPEPFWDQMEPENLLRLLEHEKSSVRGATWECLASLAARGLRFVVEGTGQATLTAARHLAAL